MKTMRDILLKNDLLEKQLNELKEIIIDIANERSTTGFYDLLRFMPITNMFINVFGMFKDLKILFVSIFFISIDISRREQLEKRINKVLKN
jgi:hypothetical protein